MSSGGATRLFELPHTEPAGGAARDRWLGGFLHILSVVADVILLGAVLGDAGGDNGALQALTLTWLLLPCLYLTLRDTALKRGGWHAGSFVTNVALNLLHVRVLSEAASAGDAAREQPATGDKAVAAQRAFRAARLAHAALHAVPQLLTQASVVVLVGGAGGARLLSMAAGAASAVHALSTANSAARAHTPAERAATVAYRACELPARALALGLLAALAGPAGLWGALAALAAVSHVMLMESGDAAQRDGVGRCAVRSVAVATHAANVAGVLVHHGDGGRHAKRWCLSREPVNARERPDLLGWNVRYSVARALVAVHVAANGVLLLVCSDLLGGVVAHDAQLVDLRAAEVVVIVVIALTAAQVVAFVTLLQSGRPARRIVQDVADAVHVSNPAAQR